jgi:peptidoglycan hydrolase CwlO-like protein
MEDLKSILKEYTEEVKRHISILKEDVDGRVQTIGEQYGSIDKKLDSHAEAITEVKEDIAIIKMDIEFIKAGIKQKVDVEEFSALEKRVAILESKLKPT